MTNLIKYSKQCTVHFKDWTSFDCPEEKVEAVFHIWDTKWSLRFKEPIDWLMWIDWAMISKIEEWFAKPDIKSLTPKQQQQLKARIKKFKDNLARDPIEETIYEWCEKLKKWLSI